MRRKGINRLGLFAGHILETICVPAEREQLLAHRRSTRMRQNGLEVGQFCRGQRLLIEPTIRPVEDSSRARSRRARVG